ncbi:hypothetical protein [Kribbella sp. NBC_00889]|uniref:hypothetical protein n=1 Tax=Kribbella sp. NBC_00889 TaxID=2975974 RepID=UPI00386B5AAC|nr:hypothetical protein OG817_44935 [Kribbella sp. NBC_00889]
MDDKLIPVLVGAVLTLTATVLVQVVVVPWVQARTCRVERWETSVVELVSLLEEELPRAVSDCRSAAEAELTYRSLQDVADFDQNRVRESLQQALNSRREVNEVVGQRRRRMKVLVNRVTRVRRRAPMWRTFRVAQVMLTTGSAVPNT